MKEHKAGNFTIEVSSPYPCWLRIKRDGAELYGIHHKEIADLQYALERAQITAVELLGKEGREAL